MNFFREKRSFHNELTGITQNGLFSFQHPYEIDRSALSAYLRLGYVPGDKTLFKGIRCVPAISPTLETGKNGIKALRNLSQILSQIPEMNHSPCQLKELLIRAIEKRYRERKMQVVPLSGGMDSRIILAALCEITEASNIHTYTFGVPGSFDYEIPNKIAQKIGTKHQNFSALKTNYTIAGLIRAAIASDGNTEVFHPIVLNNVVDYYGSAAIYWSGFAGDLVGGGFGEKLVGSNPKQLLINYETRGINFLDKTDPYNLPSLISNGEKMSDYVSKAEACFWENHVERYTGHHIFRNDMTLHAPLVDSTLLKFFFTLPESERKNKKFFNEAFSSIFQDVFDIPTKDYGYKYSKLRLRQSWHRSKFYLSALGWRLAPNLITHPNVAYIDMQHAINTRHDIKYCIDLLFDDLARRDIIDSKKMYAFLSAHRSGKINYTKDIINLASLEVILKASNL
jgi:hypothetical protein